MCICLIGDLDTLVKPALKDQWVEAKNRWFVVNVDDPMDIRKPGKMKLEWQTEHGAMIA